MDLAPAQRCEGAFFCARVLSPDDIQGDGCQHQYKKSNGLPTLGKARAPAVRAIVFQPGGQGAHAFHAVGLESFVPLDRPEDALKSGRIFLMTLDIRLLALAPLDVHQELRAVRREADVFAVS